MNETNPHAKLINWMSYELGFKIVSLLVTLPRVCCVLKELLDFLSIKWVSINHAYHHRIKKDEVILFNLDISIYLV